MNGSDTPNARHMNVTTAVGGAMSTTRWTAIGWRSGPIQSEVLQARATFDDLGVESKMRLGNSAW